MVQTTSENTSTKLLEKLVSLLHFFYKGHPYYQGSSNDRLEEESHMNQPGLTVYHQDTWVCSIVALTGTSLGARIKCLFCMVLSFHPFHREMW